MGTWYEIQRYPHRNQPNGDCVVVNYALNQTSGEVAILNRMWVLADDATVEARGTAVTDPEYPGQGVLRVRFEETPPEVPASYYRILGVVYDRYAVVWSCRENGANSVGKTVEWFFKIYVVSLIYWIIIFRICLGTFTSSNVGRCFSIDR